LGWNFLVGGDDGDGNFGLGYPTFGRDSPSFTETGSIGWVLRLQYRIYILVVYCQRVGVAALVIQNDVNIGFT
jgi:hypothetical protein